MVEDVFKELEFTAEEEVTKLGLTPHGWPPEPMSVKSVEAGTWAETSGVQLGDGIVRINGRDIQELDKAGIVSCLKMRPLTMAFTRRVPTVTATEDDVRLGMQPGNWPPGLVHVRHVEPGSWAERSGIEEGSAIIAVNGTSVETMDMLQFRTLLRARPLTLAVAKPGEYEPVKSPSAMQRGLRFSIVAGESPLQSPLDGAPSGPLSRMINASSPNSAAAEASGDRLGAALKTLPEARKQQEPRKEVSLMQGWMTKRGPTISYKWLKRWCVLYEDTLMFYADSNCREKKGDVKLKRGSRVVAFIESKAPGDSVKHRVDKPFGFAVDPDPSAGKNRRLHYFDPADAEQSSTWRSGFANATAGLTVTLTTMNSLIRRRMYSRACESEASRR